jgi:DNA-binding NarL/FixJ family response regulator
MITIALVDDSIMFRQLLAESINKWQGFSVAIQAGNGIDLLNQLKHVKKNLPQVAIIDIQMPVMNGFETAEQIHKQYPQINMLALSQYDDEVSVQKMMAKGALGFVSKFTDANEIRIAITNVSKGEYYYNKYFSTNTLQYETVKNKQTFTEREILLIKFCATEMSVKEMADKLGTGIKKINKIKHQLFIKLNACNRSSLVSAALKLGIINTSDL